MKNKAKWRNNYLLYDENETLVFEGTSTECAEWLGISMQWFYIANHKGRKFHRKYTCVCYGRS